MPKDFPSLKDYPKLQELSQKIFSGKFDELPQQETLDSYSEWLLKQIHGDKVRHHYTCPKHGADSIWVPPGENPENYPHSCPVCEHEQERENARRSEICARLRRVADSVGSFMSECGVTRADYTTFEEFFPETRSQALAKEACENFANGFCTRLFENRAEIGIWMHGLFGSGKTHLATAILTVLQKRGVPGVIIKTADLLDALNSDTSKLSKRIGALGKVSCLVLDDFGATTLTDSEQKRVFQIVDARIQAKLPTIYTTNISFEEFEKTFNGRLVSRVRGVTAKVPVVGPDHRGKECPTVAAFME